MAYNQTRRLYKTNSTITWILVYLTVITSPALRSISFICAIKMDATASYKAVPSILIVAPTGSTNLLITGETPAFVSKQCIVTGNVAALKKARKI